MVGPVIDLLSVSYCSASQAVAPYHLSHPGTYTVEVLHIHTNYSLHTPSPVNKPDNLLAASFLLETLVKPEHGLPKVRSEFCTVLDAPGKWLYETQEASMLHTCVHEGYNTGCLPQHIGTERGKSGLTWWQPDCELHDTSSQQIRTCLDMRKLCLFGDSHMRFLFNSIYDLVEGNHQALRSKTVRRSDLMTFYSDPWGWLQHKEEQNCSIILRNTGAWHASSAIHGAGQSWPDLEAYAAQVSNLANSMQSAKKRGTQVIWMTTNGQPINLAVHAHEDVKRKDFRTDPMLVALNRVANIIMAENDIPIFDTWSMTSAVADTAFDGAHFAGDVGDYITRRLLSSLCQ